MPSHMMQFESIEELVSEAEKNYLAGKCAFDPRSSFHGVDTFEQAFALARTGWEDQRADTMELVELALESVDAMITRPAFFAQHDVSGGIVDMSRFLAGDPECMFDFLLTEEQGMDKLVTIVVSISASGGIDVSTKIAYGRLIAALIFALDRMGVNTEIYCEWGNSNASFSNPTAGSVRTKIKGSNDELDAARILYGVAHPSMHRVLCWAACLSAPQKIVRTLRWHTGNYPMPIPPVEDMGEGVTYMPMIKYGMGKEKASAFITRYFRMLGIVEA